MKLIIMRHGKASWSALSDAARELTPAGREKVLKTAEQLRSQSVELVLASPYLRAQQTGEIVSETLGCRLETLDSITPDGHPPSIINELPESGTVLLASHMPLVSRLTGLLCEGSMGGGLDFPTAAAVVLEMDVPAAGMATIVKQISF